MIALQNSSSLSSAELNAAEIALDAFLTRQDLGFFKINQHSPFVQQISQVQQDCAKLNLDAVVVVGIGGSYLGAQALWQALKGQLQSSMELMFICSTDPQSLTEKLKSLATKNSYFVYVSKSGQTLETQAAWSLIDQWRKSIKGTYHACVVTEPKDSPMRARANELSLRCVDVPFDVGGRFSVFTAVGLLPLALVGFDIQRAFSALEKLQQEVKSGGLGRNQVIQLSAMIVHQIKSETVQVSWWSYSDRLKELGFWWQQLWAESLAQSKCANGKPAPRVPIPLVSVGPQDQHSTLQMFMEGRWPTWSIVVGDLALEADANHKVQSEFRDFDWVNGKQLGTILKTQRIATEAALKEAGHQTTAVDLQGVTLESLSRLMQIWMLSVGAVGQSLGVNVFVQPGVELGKRLAREILTKGD